ncbi:WD40-repeat-containing domain protein [Leucosporidium creatinivorum]|uniref:WD40-repeat-containing domain protein n=1 Tax=Leucosporidium creatinivorum TaxID=106004 RepID=A0A1Y2FJW1_9BASI|nr:WD40-repeat-containing domain protein [Leucosporidium creatinivorum]
MDTLSHPDSTPRPPPAAPPAPAHATAVDAQIHERLLRDYKRLKVRVDGLEKENEGLRASLWEVSWRWGRRDKGGNKGRQEQPEGPAEEAATTPTAGPAAAPAAAIPAVQATPSTPSTVQDLATPTSQSPAVAQSEFMRLNEPIARAPALTPSHPPLPSTPSSLAASLFPNSSIPTLGSLNKPAPTPSAASSAHANARIPSNSSHPDRDRDRHDRDVSLKRDLDISLPSHRASSRPAHSSESWRWTRGYDLKGHRGAVYALKFGSGNVGNRGRLLGSAGMDGVRIWGTKEGANGREEDAEGEEGDAWDEGDVEEIAHLTSHTGPVSDLSFSPDMNHLLSGGYDSQLFIHSLSSLSSSSSSASPAPTPASATSNVPSPADSDPPFKPVWSLATEGLVQSVCWIHPQAGAELGGEGASASNGNNLFAWGTSGKMLGVGDLRMHKPVMEVECGAMVNSVQSFRRTSTLLIGDSQGSIRHFSLRNAAFLPFPDLSSSAAAALATTGAGAKKGPPPISCLALNPDWLSARRAGGSEPRWMAGVGFDNFVRIYDRSLADPLKLASSAPKLVQTLKGKNRNWPIKASWFQGRDYADAPPQTKRRLAHTSASRTRSRSASFSSHPDSDNSDSDLPHRHHLHHRTKEERDRDRGGEEGEGKERQRPLASSLLLAVGSSDPVVLLYDVSGVSESSSTGAGGEEGKETSGSGAATPSSSAPRLLQRLEGHKESVYAVDFLQAAGGEEGYPGYGSTGAARGGDGYSGPGLLASAGGDWVVKVWKPVFKEEE